MNQIAYKFVSWDVPALESLAGSKAYILRKRLNDGGTLTREEKDWITREVNHNTYFKDSIPLLGYRFNFVDVLKTFVVKQYGHYTEYKGVDKTSIRSSQDGPCARRGEKRVQNPFRDMAKVQPRHYRGTQHLHHEYRDTTTRAGRDTPQEQLA